MYLIAESPYLINRNVGQFWRSHEVLRADNRGLQRKILELSEMSQQAIALRSENDRLRGLLGSQARLPYEVLIAELVGVVPNPNTLQIIIDKGTNANIQPGQAVLDAYGLCSAKLLR